MAVYHVQHATKSRDPAVQGKEYTGVVEGKEQIIKPLESVSELCLRKSQLDVRDEC